MTNKKNKTKQNTKETNIAKKKKKPLSSPQKTWWGKLILIVAVIGMALLPLAYLVKIIIDLL